MDFECLRCKKHFKVNMVIPEGTIVKQECPWCGSMETRMVAKKKKADDAPPPIATHERE